MAALLKVMLRHSPKPCPCLNLSALTADKNAEITVAIQGSIARNMGASSKARLIVVAGPVLLRLAARALSSTHASNPVTRSAPTVEHVASGYSAPQMARAVCRAATPNAVIIRVVRGTIAGAKIHALLKEQLIVEMDELVQTGRNALGMVLVVLMSVRRSAGITLVKLAIFVGAKIPVSRREPLIAETASPAQPGRNAHRMANIVSTLVSSIVVRTFVTRATSAAAALVA
jgi:hypothetical protein